MTLLIYGRSFSIGNCPKGGIPPAFFSQTGGVGKTRPREVACNMSGLRVESMYLTLKPV